MSANDIRSKEALIQITVDSVRRGTVKVKDLSIKPNTERNMTQYPGEKRKSSDISVSGYDVSFKANARDHAWWDIVNLVQEADRAGQAMPRISIAVTLSYRGGVGSRTLTLAGGGEGGETLFPDEALNIPESAAEYVSSSWTGFFPEMTSST